MILKVIMGKRKCLYPGEHTCEAFEVTTEFDHKENPGWIQNKLEELRKRNSRGFTAFEIINVKVNDNEIDAILTPETKTVLGLISKESDDQG